MDAALEREADRAVHLVRVRRHLPAGGTGPRELVGRETRVRRGRAPRAEEEAVAGERGVRKPRLDCRERRERGAELLAARCMRDRPVDRLSREPGKVGERRNAPGVQPGPIGAARRRSDVAQRARAVERRLAQCRLETAVAVSSAVADLQRPAQRRVVEQR